MHEQRRRAMEVGKQQLKQRNDEANNDEQISKAAENRMSVVRRILEFCARIAPKARSDTTVGIPRSLYYVVE